MARPNARVKGATAEGSGDAAMVRDQALEPQRDGDARPGPGGMRVIEGGRARRSGAVSAAMSDERARMTTAEDAALLAEEGALIARFAAGDARAAEALTEALLPGAFRQAWRLLGDQSEAEDVAQEAMLRFWRQAQDWRQGEARASTWLYRVTRNLCIDRLRRRRSMADIDDVPEPADPVPAVLERLQSAEQSRALARAIAELPARQRDALVLRHFEGCSNPDIAERLDCSVEAVESLLARARRQLASRMRREEGDET
ncbi:MAG: sigma-70 family RNA polymerase sigma factor [Pseudomonadota bacterium]